MRVDLIRSRYEDDDTTEADVESWFHDMDANKDEFVDVEEYKAFFLKSNDDAVSCCFYFFDICIWNPGYQCRQKKIHSLVQPYNISESELLDTFKLLDPAGTGKVNMAQWKLLYIKV